MIAILDYGLGNVRAFANVYKRQNVEHLIAQSAADLEHATGLILPGVGSFDQAVNSLRNSPLYGALREAVEVKQRPVLGICVGMQMLANSSEEGVEPGLGWVPGTVRRFRREQVESKLPLPHMGWNGVAALQTDHLLMKGLCQSSEFYFLHSYYFECAADDNALTTTTYGFRFASAVAAKNVYGVQFHPEKSHQYGVRLLQNFADIANSIAPGSAVA